RDELAPARDEDLLPRLECRSHGALRQVLGAGGSQARYCFGSTACGTALGEKLPGRLRWKNAPACQRKIPRNAATNAAPLHAPTCRARTISPASASEAPTRTR